ncbi:MAG: DUF2135 domain-containing protein, partial [Flavobacteriales bacterium]
KKPVIIDTIVNATDTSSIAQRNVNDSVWTNSDGFVSTAGSNITVDQIANMPERRANTIAATVGEVEGVIESEEVHYDVTDAVGSNSVTLSNMDVSANYTANATFSHDLNSTYQFSASVTAKSDDAFNERNLIEDKKEIKLKKWDSKAEYIKTLKKEKTDNLYESYTELKKENNTSPSFYLDVCTYFQEKNKLQLAERILSNLAELEGENHELLRGLANKLQDLKQQQKAVEILEEVKELRKEEPQSYRDLGLAYAKNNQPQKAIEALYKIVTTKWSRFTNIEQIAINEMNQVIDANPDVNTNFIDSALLKHLPVDMRVVLNWDADATDIDLWVTDPTGEKCFYSHNRTKIGGFMTNDFTQGYGPEVFMIKRGMKGKYKIEANYYGNNSTKTLGPVTLKMQFFTNYGKPNQKVKEVILRLKDSKEVVEIAEIGI